MKDRKSDLVQTHLGRGLGLAARETSEQNPGLFTAGLRAFESVTAPFMFIGHLPFIQRYLSTFCVPGAVVYWETPRIRNVRPGS